MAEEEAQVAQKLYDENVVKATRASEGILGETDPNVFYNFKQAPKRIIQTEKLNAVDWLDSRYCVIATQDGNAIVYDTHQKDVMSYAYVMGSWMNSLKFNQATAGTNSALLAVGGLNNIVTVVNLEHKSLMDTQKMNSEDGSDKPREFVKHMGPIYAIEWLDETTLLSGSGDNCCYLWDIAASDNKVVKMPTREFKIHSADVAALCKVDTNTFITGGGDKICHMVDKRADMDFVATFAGHQDAITGVKQFKGMSTFASSSDDGVVRVWDQRTGTSLTTLGGGNIDNDLECSALELSSSGRLLFAGYSDGSIQQYDVLSGESQAFKSNHDGSRVTCIARNTDGTALASTGRVKEPKENFMIWH